MIHYTVFFKPDPTDRSFPIDEVDGAASLDGKKVTVYGTPEFVEQMQGFFMGPTWDSIVRDSERPFEEYLRNPYMHAQFLQNGTPGEKAAKFQELLARIPNRTSKVVSRRRVSSADINQVRVMSNE